jgi:hypothetical protein
MSGTAQNVGPDPDMMEIINKVRNGPVPIDTTNTGEVGKITLKDATACVAAGYCVFQDAGEETEPRWFVMRKDVA